MEKSVLTGNLSSVVEQTLTEPVQRSGSRSGSQLIVSEANAALSAVEDLTCPKAVQHSHLMGRSSLLHLLLSQIWWLQFDRQVQDLLFPLTRANQCVQLRSALATSPIWALFIWIKPTCNCQEIIQSVHCIQIICWSTRASTRSV